MAGEGGISIAEVARRSGRYPPEAYEFVSAALRFTADRVYGSVKAAPEGRRHVSGEDLCWGLRDLAVRRWGLMARTVLEQWNLISTADVGRVVFDLIDCGLMQRREDDTVEDFDEVFNFRQAFDRSYRFDFLQDDREEEEEED